MSQRKIKKKIQKSFFIKKDLYLIAVVLFVAVVSALIYYFSMGDAANQVRVELGGELYQTYDLSTDGEYRIETPKGYNVLSIKNGEVSISESDCKNQICVKEGTVSKDGQSIVCLPHQLVVTVVNDQKSEMDAVAR